MHTHAHTKTNSSVVTTTTLQNLQISSVDGADKNVLNLQMSSVHGTDKNVMVQGHYFYNILKKETSANILYVHSDHT